MFFIFVLFIYDQYFFFLNKSSLVMNTGDSDQNITPTHLFGSVNGSLGVIAPLNHVQFRFLFQLEQALRQVIKGVGALK